MNTQKQAAHTPGPWKQRDCNVYGDGWLDPIACTSTAQPYGKGLHAEKRLNLDFSEARANARLIAAAPAILAALEQMLAAFPAPKIRAANGFEGNLAHAVARTAIAAATGDAS